MNEPVRSGVLPAALASLRAPFERGPRVLIALVTLCGIGFSLALFVIELGLSRDQRADFMIKNAVPLGTRGKILAALLVTMLLPAVLTGFLWLVRSAQGRAELFERRLERWTAIGAPLCLAFMLPVLFESRLALTNATMYLVLLSLFVVASRFLFERAFSAASELSRPRPPAKLARVGSALAALGARLPRLPLGTALVVLAAVGYALFGAYYAVQSHRLIQTTAFDLGVYDNLMFNAVEGRPFQSSLKLGSGHKSYLGLHGEFAMLLFAPLYALWPKPETLLILQATLLGLAAIPLYLFARRLLTGAAPLILSLAYLLFAPVHGPTLADFHWLPLSIFFLFLTFYAIAANIHWLLVPSVGVLFALHEDLAVGLCLLGVFLGVTRARVRLGWALAAVAALWFAVENFWLMPRFAAPAPVARDPFVSNTTLASTIVMLFTNPSHVLQDLVREVRVQYAVHMLAPLAFLPVRRVAFLLLLVPGALSSLVASGYWPHTTGAFQNVAHYVPYVFLSAALGLWMMQSEVGAGPRRAAALVTLAVALLGHSHCYGAVLQRETFQRSLLNAPPEMTRETWQRYEQLRSVVARIPRDASVAATDYTAPHASSRSQIVSFRQDFGPVDYILLSNREIHGENQRRLTTAVSKHSYRLVVRAAEFFLFKRGDSSPETEQALTELGAVPHPIKR